MTFCEGDKCALQTRTPSTLPPPPIRLIRRVEDPTGRSTVGWWLWSRSQGRKVNVLIPPRSPLKSLSYSHFSLQRKHNFCFNNGNGHKGPKNRSDFFINNNFPIVKSYIKKKVLKISDLMSRKVLFLLRLVFTFDIYLKFYKVIGKNFSFFLVLVNQKYYNNLKYIRSIRFDNGKIVQ